MVVSKRRPVYGVSFSQYLAAVIITAGLCVCIWWFYLTDRTPDVRELTKVEGIVQSVELGGGGSSMYVDIRLLTDSETLFRIDPHHYGNPLDPERFQGTIERGTHLALIVRTEDLQQPERSQFDPVYTVFAYRISWPRSSDYEYDDWRQRVANDRRSLMILLIFTSGTTVFVLAGWWLNARINRRQNGNGESDEDE